MNSASDLTPEEILDRIKAARNRVDHLRVTRHDDDAEVQDAEDELDRISTRVRVKRRRRPENG